MKKEINYTLEKNDFKKVAKSFAIPKRIFSSEEEINEVWNLIQNCYNKSRENI